MKKLFKAGKIITINLNNYDTLNPEKKRVLKNAVESLMKSFKKYEPMVFLKKRNCFCIFIVQPRRFYEETFSNRTIGN